MPATRLIYLDHAAATPLDTRVRQAMEPYFSDDFYNPSAAYLAGRRVRAALETARGQVARVLGSRSSEVVFTAGGSEANNLAVQGVMRQFPDANVVVSAIEHDSVLETARQFDCREAKVGPDGLIDLADLARQIDDKTVLVSIMYANNEIGTIQPIRQIARLIQDARATRPTGARPLYFHTDACQAANYLDLHVSRLGIDLMTLNGGKIYGPKQSGILYAKSSVHLLPLIFGGGQERSLRSGTENVAGSIGFAAALELAQDSRREAARRLAGLQQHFFKVLLQHLPQAVVNGSRKHRLPGNVHLTIPGTDNERLLVQLDEAGIQAAAGSACSASDDEPSHVLRAIGLSDDQARASLRFSLGRATAEADIDAAVSVLARLVTG
jgi:cysteine desulfurase